MKTIRIAFVVVMVAILGLAWFSQISSAGNTISEFNRFVKEGDAAYKKTHYQEAYISYEKAVEINKSTDVQDKILIAYKDRYEETKESSDLEGYIEAYQKAYSRFSDESKYYEGTIALMIKDYQIDNAMGVYNDAVKNHVHSGELDKQYTAIIRSWEIERAGYIDYKEPFNGYYSYYKETGWNIAKEDNKKDVLTGFAYASRVGDDEILLTENLRGKCEFIDTLAVVRGKIKDKVEEAGIYNNGFVPIKTNQKYKYTDLDGEKTFGSYMYAGTFINSRAAVQLDSSEWTIINTEGKPISEKKFENIVLNKRDSCFAGENGDKIICKKNGKYYVYSADCSNEICCLDCDEIDIITEDNIFAAKKSGKWGFVDINGQWIINPQYEEAKSFSNGFAAVKGTNSWMLINKDNQKIIDKGFDYIGYVNSDGYVMVKTQNDEGEENKYFDWIRFPYFDLLTGRK